MRLSFVPVLRRTLSECTLNLHEGTSSLLREKTRNDSYTEISFITSIDDPFQSLLLLEYSTFSFILENSSGCSPPFLYVFSYK